MSVYQQPSRSPVITTVKSPYPAYPAGGSPQSPAVSRYPTPRMSFVAAAAGADSAMIKPTAITNVAADRAVFCFIGLSSPPVDATGRPAACAPKACLGGRVVGTGRTGSRSPPDIRQ